MAILLIFEVFFDQVRRLLLVPNLSEVVLILSGVVPILSGVVLILSGIDPYPDNSVYLQKILIACYENEVMKISNVMIILTFFSNS